jgi:hypothetical protein
MFCGCSREEVTKLEGRFRTAEPYAPMRNPPAYLEAVFTRQGTAQIYLIDENGRLGDPRKDPMMKYTISESKIVFALRDASEDVLFDPPLIQVKNSRTLKLLHDGKLTLKKID